MPTRRQFIGGVASAAGLAGIGLRSAQAQGTVDGWPSRSVRVISPTGTGGPGQNFRLYADQLKDKFGQSFVLENMPGGSGSIGCMAVARSAPDGHTLLLASNSHIVLAPLVLANSPVNVKKDFVPISLMFTFPFLLLVNSGLPVRSLKELVDYAKARPNQLNFGSPGVGTGGHLVTELLVKRTGIQAVHVPYQATTQQMMAAAAGTLQFTFDTVGNARGMVDAGKVIPLAVTGARRAISAPDVPTFKELGYDIEFYIWAGLFAPKATPAPVISRLREGVAQVVKDPEFIATMEKAGTPISYLDAPEFQKYWDKDAAMLAAAVKRVGKVEEK